MMHNLIVFILMLGLVAASTTTTSCKSKPNGLQTVQRSTKSDSIASVDRRPERLPQRAFDLSVPKVPNHLYQGHDLREVEIEAIYGTSQLLYNEGSYGEAARLQYWSTTRSDSGWYNCACSHALAGQIEAAFYFLQEGALSEGINAEWASQDPDLASLRRDPRWTEMKQFLTQVSRYWATSDVKALDMILPTDTNTDRVDVVVWLHGLGGNPKVPASQELADTLNVAFLGVSGTVPSGPNAFSWSEDVLRDFKRVDESLKTLAETIPIGSVVLVGFSQGAYVATELAANYPKRFQGALILSPGGNEDPEIPQDALLTGQVYRCSVGAKEHPGNVASTEDLCAQLKARGAKTVVKLYEDVSAHTFPPDYLEALEVWVSEALGRE